LQLIADAAGALRAIGRPSFQEAAGDVVGLDAERPE